MSIALEKSCAAKIGSKTTASLPPPFKTCPLAFKILSEACFIAGGNSIPACVKSKNPAKLLRVMPWEAAYFLTAGMFLAALRILFLSSP